MNPVQRGPDGRHYIDGPGGRTYISPAAMGNRDGSGLGEGGGLLRHRGQWNQRTGRVEQPFNWNNAFAMGIGGLLAAPAVAGAFGGGGLSAASTAAQTGAALPAGAVTATGAGGGMGSIGSFLSGNAGLNMVNQGVGAVTNYLGNRAQTRANDRAAQLEADATAATLAFLKEQEATRAREFRETEAKNLGLYREQQARLEPYRRLGRGSIGQLMSHPALAASQKGR